MERLYNGVKAEPKFLRDPTSLESISSGISRLSGYVASNLPKRRQSAPVDHYAPFSQDEPTEEDCKEPTDTITFATFAKLNIQNETRNCLLLGYQDGFQVWDISNPDNIHELCSIKNREMFTNVTFIHYLTNNHETEQILAIVCEAEMGEIPNESKHTRRDSFKGHPRPSVVKIYSLKTQSIIKELHEFDKDEDTQVTCIKSNHKVIVLGCLSQSHSSIHILSINDFSPMSSPLADVYHENGPLFALGTRFIAYATNAAVLNSDPVMSALTNKGIGYTGIGVLQGEKDMKGAAKDIAKEVASGMKSLGELGYSRLTNYFNSGHNHHVQHDIPQKEHLITGGVASNMTTPSTKKQAPMGMIMIRDLQKLPPYGQDHATKSYINSSSVIAHFRPHTHAISCLSFNPAGTLLLSASKQGHTFHVFSMLTTAHVAHIYSLSRGITDAQVVDCQFSVDSTWCAVSTARGTTHLYAINPYGGRPDINSHVHSKVNNLHPLHTFYNNNKPNQHKAVTLNSIIRIKQRRKMPLNENDESLLLPQSVHNNSTLESSRAKISTTFISIPPSSHIINSNISSSLSSSSASLPLKPQRHSSGTQNHYPYQYQHHQQQNQQQQNLQNLQQLKHQSFSSMLSSFGSSYNTPKWMMKKSNDPLMFGFDEEYEDDKMMVNDEIGYQDMYSFHPDGYLTLHRCWVAKVMVRKRENNRVLDKTDFSIKEEDVAEWRVARNPEWDQVKLDLSVINNTNNNGKKEKKEYLEKLPPYYSAPPHTTNTTPSKKRWLSNAEISTYHAEKSALWTYHQFSFQTYNNTGHELQHILSLGLVPPTKKIVLLKGIPEPISSRFDRVKKTSNRITNNDNDVNENLDDALAELEDNISKAMQTSFTPSTSIGNSPSSFKWLSSSANAASPSTPRSLMTDRKASVSFEDAYLINMASDPMQHSSLIQFDSDDDEEKGRREEEDVIRLEEDDEREKRKKSDFSPDGDNEIASPSDSFFGGHFGNDKNW